MKIERLRRVIAASPPLLLTILIAKLWLTGTLGYYVNDRTIWIVVLGGALFAGVGLVGLREALSPGSHEPRLTIRSLVFLVPVLVGLILPARPLSATSGQASTLGALALTSHVSSGGGDSFGTWVSDLSDHPDLGWWSGRHATLTGFVARQSGLPARSFIVGRYLVTCCVVDATLLGFPVQLDRGSPPPQGAWVQVSGVFGRLYWTDPTGAHYPILQHVRIAPASVPASPYLSP
jgi:uncharacterized repeat protein (TIGR03943 family)